MFVFKGTSKRSEKSVMANIKYLFYFLNLQILLSHPVTRDFEWNLEPVLYLEIYMFNKDFITVLFQLVQTPTLLVKRNILLKMLSYMFLKIMQKLPRVDMLNSGHLSVADNFLWV